MKETKDLSRKKRDKLFAEPQITSEDTNSTDDAIAYDLPETDTSASEPKRQRGGKKGSMFIVVLPPILVCMAQLSSYCLFYMFLMAMLLLLTY